MENETSLPELPNLDNRPAMQGGGTLGEITEAMKQDREEKGYAKIVRDYVAEMAKKVTGRDEVLGEIATLRYATKTLEAPGFGEMAAILINTGREKRLGFILERQNSVDRDDRESRKTVLAFPEGDTYYVNTRSEGEGASFLIHSVSVSVDFATADGKRNRDRYEIVKGVAENDKVSIDNDDRLYIDPTGEKNGGIKVTPLKLEDLQSDTLSPVLPKGERTKNSAYEIIKALTPRLYKRE
jgi:hypothetical protein